MIHIGKKEAKMTREWQNNYMMKCYDNWQCYIHTRILPRQRTQAVQSKSGLYYNVH